MQSGLLHRLKQNSLKRLVLSSVQASQVHVSSFATIVIGAANAEAELDEGRSLVTAVVSDVDT